MTSLVDIAVQIITNNKLLLHYYKWLHNNYTKYINSKLASDIPIDDRAVLCSGDF